MLFACSFFGAALHGQEPIDYLYTQIEHSDSSVHALEIMLQERLGIEVQLTKESERISQIGKHEQFQIRFEEFPIYHAKLKRNSMRNGSTTISFPNEQISIQKSAIHAITSRSIQGSFYHSFQSIYSSGYQIIKHNDIWSTFFVVDGISDGEHVEKIFGLQGEEIGARSMRMMNHRDTTIRVQVFAPDPLTTSNSEYGSSIEDLEDNLSDAIIAEYVFDSLTVRFDSQVDAWALKSDAAQAIDLYPPFSEPPTSTTGNFDYDRNEPEFEYVNAFFHINQQKQHLEELGFDSVVNYSIEFDAHGDFEDQSYFDPITLDVGQLVFGDGGVDDAEDADVIVHEYGHAISYSVAPGTVVGNEREAIEEGLCDFFAFAYSLDLSPNQRTRIFNWDGHNEYWNGRELTYTRTYPSDLEDELYLDAPMWSSALADIHDYCGRNITETLLLNSMYSYHSYMSMIDAGALLMQADSLIYNGVHIPVIELILCKRGLLEGCQDTNVVDTPLEDPFVGGHKNFSSGSAPLYLYPNDRTMLSYSLYNLNGMLVDHQVVDETKLFYELDYQGLHTGFYILSVKTTEGDFSFKLLKQNN